MESMRVFCVDHLLKLVSWKGVHRTLSMDALQGTNISLPKACLKMGFFSSQGEISSFPGSSFSDESEWFVDLFEVEWRKTLGGGVFWVLLNHIYYIPLVIWGLFEVMKYGSLIVFSGISWFMLLKLVRHMTSWVEVESNGGVPRQLRVVACFVEVVSVDEIHYRFLTDT